MFPNPLHKLINKLHGVLFLEDIFPHKTRKHLNYFLGVIFIVSIVLVVFLGESNDSRIKAALALSGSLYAVIFALDSYFYSFYTRSVDRKFKVSFEIGDIIYYSEDDDITKGFIYSETGDETLKRLGFTEQEITSFLKNRTHISFDGFLNELQVDHITSIQFGELMMKHDKQLSGLLFTKGLVAKDFLGALLWVIEREERKIDSERWWSKETLGKLPGIGKNWSYGQTYNLERYGEDITERLTSHAASYENAYDKQVLKLESVLSKSSGANAIIISDDESSRLDIVEMLGRKIKEGVVFPILSHRRIYIINPNLIIESSDDKITFERELSFVLDEAAHALNVILVFPNLSGFIKSAHVLGSDVLSIFSPYLNSSVLNILALDSKSEYHNFLSEKEIIKSSFEPIIIEEGNYEGVFLMLKNEALRLEKEAPVFVTYPALVAVAEYAKRFFDSYAYVDKAKDLLIESAPFALSHGEKVITKEIVGKMVESKTGIPTSKPEGKEREMLLNLEDLLHERVIGQDEAIKLISSALKRSRAGVQNPDKPIGTFLFLGPTGVGKTETTKALASIFFGNEESIGRLDMSEYKDNESIDRLIGSFTTGKAGTLSMMLREKPYGVLLLDEFEKTTTDVINLFLRIFDEGVFTDAESRKINAKNNIIIATSNAGSEAIWDIVKNGGDLNKAKEEIIDLIIKQGIFKPELLNRFDAVILFHPLGKEELKKIALLMLAKLTKRMKPKGYDIEASPDIIDFLVEKGSDPKFGARPMARAIQEEIEDLIAEAIIAGNVREGSKISFVKENNSLKAISI